MIGCSKESNWFRNHKTKKRKEDILQVKKRTFKTAKNFRSYCDSYSNISLVTHLISDSLHLSKLQQLQSPKLCFQYLI